MAYVREEEETRGRRITLANRIRALERKKTIAERDAATIKETKQFSWPFKWKSKFNRSGRKVAEERMLVIYFNKKNEIEPPRFMPIFDGNMIVWKNKPYEFDPRAIWRIKGVKRQPMVYCIREIDRRPIKNPDGGFKTDRLGRRIYGSDAAISNNDINDVRERGDSTESDEFLIKAALKAQTSQTKKNLNMGAIAIVLIVAAGFAIWFFSSGG